MKTITGEEVVIAMLEFGAEIAHWNRKYIRKEIITQRLDELGLTNHQLDILGILFANPQLNRVSALSANLFISKGSLSLMLSKLEKGGFLEKMAATGEDDGRKVYVSLTEKGIAAVEEIRQLLVSTAAVAFEEMNSQKRTLFYTKLKELQELFLGGTKQ